MHLRTSLFSLFLLFSLGLAGQVSLSRPLSYVPGDSVVAWAADPSDFRSAPLHVDGTITGRTVTAKGIDRHTVEGEIRTWEEMMRRQDIVGGAGHQDGASQIRAAIEMVNRSAPLMLRTADSRFVDGMERPLFNLLPAVVTAPDSGTPTLRHEAARTLFDAAGMIYATDRERSVYINFFLNSTTHIVTKRLDLVIDQLTAMPHAGMVKIRLSNMANGERIRLCVRIPAWAEGRTPAPQGFAYAEKKLPLAEVLVNGREVLQMTYEKGYAVIDRAWNSGDEVHIHLPMMPQYLRRIVDGKAVRGDVALQRGPLVYATEADTTGCYYSTNAPLVEAEEASPLGHPLLRGHLYVQAGIPADAPAPERPLTAEPYMDNRGTVWLKECK